MENHLLKELIAQHKARFLARSGLVPIVVELAKPDLFHLIGIRQTIEDAFGKKVDVIRFRERMNQALRRRIEKDVIYV